MDLKEARYILAIAEHKSISRAADQLFISQPSLSKYLKGIEHQLGQPLFSRINNEYIPTYMGERYLNYARNIVIQGEEWKREFQDISKRAQGRLNIAAPIMLSNALLAPVLPEFHRMYPLVSVNIMEEMNFVAEQYLKNQATDLIIYNVHDFPDKMELDYELIRDEEIVLVLPEGHPCIPYAERRSGFSFPWLDLKLVAKAPFLLQYPDQNTGGIAVQLFAEYHMDPPVVLHSRSSQLTLSLAMNGMGLTLSPASYFRYMSSQRRDHPRCFSIGSVPMLSKTIAASQPNRYLPQHAKDFIRLIQKLPVE